MAMAIVTMDLIIHDSDKRDEIVALMAEVNEMMASADGIIIHDWYANLWEPNRIRLYIENESREKAVAFEEHPSPEFVEANQRLFAYQQSGALTMQFEGLRRFEVGPELPPFAVHPE